MSVGRRAFLRGRFMRAALPMRPPGALAESAFIERCTRCAVCIDACPTGIITHGSGGYPEVDFERGECVFCGSCAVGCVPGALVEALSWPLKASVGSGCLVHGNVLCRCCGEACDARAIRFRFEAGRPTLPRIDPEACSGCGACVRACPASAIRIADPASLAAAEALP